MDRALDSLDVARGSEDSVTSQRTLHSIRGERDVSCIRRRVPLNAPSPAHEPPERAREVTPLRAQAD
jgi:hypothetical protein